MDHNLPFRNLSNSDYLNELCNETIPFYAYQHKFFDLSVSYDRFTEISNVEENTHIETGVECNYYDSGDFCHILGTAYDRELRIVSLNMRNILRINPCLKLNTTQI